MSIPIPTNKIKDIQLFTTYSILDSDFSFVICISLNGLVIDKMMLSLINRIGNERLECFSTDDFLVIDALFHDRKLSNSLRLRTKRLVDMGIIEHHPGRDKYFLARSFYDVVGKPGVHTRLVGLDRNTNKELILKHIRKNGVKGTPLKELRHVLPGHSRGPLRPKTIHMRLVIAQTLDIFKAGPACQHVVGDVQNVIGFPVRYVTFQKLEVFVDRSVQSQSVYERMHRAYAAKTNGSRSIRHLVMHVGSFEHGIRLVFVSFPLQMDSKISLDVTIFYW